MTQFDDKRFNKNLKAISTSAESLAKLIHESAMYALSQVNIHGNDGFAVRLVEAMGRKHDVERVEKWFCYYGKLGMKAGKLVFRKNKKIQPETIDAIMAEAAATPYWELNPQRHNVQSIDYLSLLAGIIKRRATISQKNSENDDAHQIEEHNVGVLDEIAKIIKAHQPVQAVAS